MKLKIGERVKIRKKWIINPRSRVVENKKKYSRQRIKKEKIDENN